MCIHREALQLVPRQYLQLLQKPSLNWTDEGGRGCFTELLKQTCLRELCLGVEAGAGRPSL